MNKVNNATAPRKNNLVQQKKVKTKRKKANKKLNQLNQIRNLVAKAKMHSEVVKKPSNSTLSDYLHQLLHFNASEKIYKIPLNINGPTYSKRSRFSLNITPSSNGNLFYAFPPSFTSRFNINATGTPAIYVRSSAYDPSSNVNALGTVLPLTDPRIISAAGINMQAGVFDAAQLTTCNIRLTISGVSALNRKGQIYIAEDRDTSWTVIQTTQTATEIDSVVNQYNIPNITKLYHHRIFDLSVNTDNNVATYHYVPEYTYANPIVHSPFNLSGVGTTTIGVDGCSAKIFMLVGAGLDPYTIITLSFEMVHEVEVNIDNLNNYPVSYSDCYTNPDPELQYLSSTKEMVITTMDQYSHKSKIENLIANRKDKDFLAKTKNQYIIM